MGGILTFIPHSRIYKKNSGIFRISVRRGRGAVRVEGVGCDGCDWALSPEKKIIFVPKVISLSALTQFLTGRKHKWNPWDMRTIAPSLKNTPLSLENYNGGRTPKFLM